MLIIDPGLYQPSADGIPRRWLSPINQRPLERDRLLGIMLSSILGESARDI
jgi:hypothetical protein